MRRERYCDFVIEEFTGGHADATAQSHVRAGTFCRHGARHGRRLRERRIDANSADRCSGAQPARRERHAARTGASPDAHADACPDPDADPDPDAYTHSPKLGNGQSGSDDQSESGAVQRSAYYRRCQLPRPRQHLVL